MGGPAHFPRAKPRTVAGGRGCTVWSSPPSVRFSFANPSKMSSSKPHVTSHSRSPPKFQTKKSMLNYVFSPLKELDYKLLEISEGPANTPFHLQWVQSITILAFGQGVPYRPWAGGLLCCPQSFFPTCSTWPEVFDCWGLGVSGLLEVCF